MLVTRLLHQHFIQSNLNIRYIHCSTFNAAELTLLMSNNNKILT